METPKLMVLGSVPKADTLTESERFVASLKKGDRVAIYQPQSALPNVESVTGVFADERALEQTGVLQQTGGDITGRKGPFVLMTTGVVFDRYGRACPCLAAEAQGIAVASLSLAPLTEKVKALFDRRRVLMNLSHFCWGLIPEDACREVLLSYGLEPEFVDDLTHKGALAILEDHKEFHPGTLSNEALFEVERIIQRACFHPNVGL